VAPACARQCPGRLRFTGYRDDKEAPIWKLVDKWKVAIPLHPEYGTEPNVFYVPPLNPASFDKDGNIDESTPRIPDEYLISVFGPQVLDSLKILKAEMAKRKAGQPSELMDILIAYKWEDNFGGFDKDPQTIDWQLAGNNVQPAKDTGNGRFDDDEEVSAVKIIDPASFG